jgi:hypothetical protein
MKYAICAYFVFNIYVYHNTYIYTPKVGYGLLKLVIISYLGIFCKEGDIEICYKLRWAGYCDSILNIILIVKLYKYGTHIFRGS